MGDSALHPDQPLWQWGPVVLNATILWTWVVMALLVVCHAADVEVAPVGS